MFNKKEKINTMNSDNHFQSQTTFTSMQQQTNHFFETSSSSTTLKDFRGSLPDGLENRFFKMSTNEDCERQIDRLLERTSSINVSKSSDFSQIFNKSAMNGSEFSDLSRSVFGKDFEEFKSKTTVGKTIRRRTTRKIVNGQLMEEEEEIDEIEHEPVAETVCAPKSKMNFKNFTIGRLKGNPFTNGAKESTKALKAPEKVETKSQPKVEKKKKRPQTYPGKIQSIINELLTIEENYVTDLRIVVEEYMPELKRKNAPEELSKNYELMFANIEIIYMFHDVQFLTALHESEKSPEEIARCFLKYKKEFALYRHYNRKKQYSEKYIQKYGGYFKKKQEEMQDPLDLCSYLIKPTQKICQYKLLMKDLANECKKHNIDSKDIDEVVAVLDAEIRLGNDLMALDAIRECKEIDVKDQGELLFRDEFIVHRGSEPVYKGIVFLFEKTMMFTKIVLENNIDVLYYKDFIYLHDIGLTPCVDDPKRFQVWFHKHTLKTFILETSDLKVKGKWVNELSKLLKDQLEKSKQEQGSQKRTLIDLKQAASDSQSMKFIP